MEIPTRTSCHVPELSMTLASLICLTVSLHCSRRDLSLDEDMDTSKRQRDLRRREGGNPRLSRLRMSESLHSYREGLEADGGLDESEEMERIGFVWESRILRRHILLRIIVLVGNRVLVDEQE